MNDILALIKPKRLSNNLAYIFKDKIVLNFNNCLDVVCYGDTNTGCSETLTIAHKDLYSETLDKASSSSYSINIPDSLVYKDFIIDANTNSFFSSISMAGEDTYWTSYLSIINSYLAYTIWGLNYKASYSSVIGCNNYDLKVSCDYNLFYYLFQFTKHLSGKKTCTIGLAKQDDYLYIANEDRSILLRQSLSHRKIRYKTKTLNDIEKLYSLEKDNSKQISKKIAIEQNGTLFKNFSRVYGDILYIKDFKDSVYYHNETFNLWLLKELEE